MRFRKMEARFSPRKNVQSLRVKRFFLVLFSFFVFLFIWHTFNLESKRSLHMSLSVLKTSDVRVHRSSEREVIIQDSVLFPDFVLVIIATTNDNVTYLFNVADNRIVCVFDTVLSDTVTYPMLSVDRLEGGGSRWSVRCPLPPGNHPASVGLLVHQNGEPGVTWSLMTNQTIKPWNKMLAYEAAFDGEETIAVFVKGLRLNGERKSDPRHFICRFGKDFALITQAITAAQEVIRCPLPQGVTKSSIEKSKEVIQVTIEKRSNNYLVPSIAKLYKRNDEDYKQERYELCACTMVWNQAEFIREWVGYHAWLGIQRWFVYDNNSDDELKDVVNDLNSEDYNVTRHVWPWVKSQEAGFSQCVLRARDQCKWVAFIDVDEFYYLPSSNSSKNSNVNDSNLQNLRDLVRNVSSSSPCIGSIRANCHDFGPSGLKKSPTKGVALGYTCRLKSHNRHKSIVRPDAVDESLLNRIHHFELQKGFRGTTFPQKTAVVNHYKYQVWNVFKAKFVRRVSAYVSDWQDKGNGGSNDRAPGLGTEAIEPPNWETKFCEVWDTGLRDFIMAKLPHPTTKLLPWQRSY